MALNSYILNKINTTEGRLAIVGCMKSVIEQLSREWLATKDQVAEDGFGDGP